MARPPFDAGLLESGGGAMTVRPAKHRDESGFVTLEVMLLVLASVLLVGGVYVLVSRLVGDAGEKAAPAETVLAYSPEVYCLGDGSEVSRSGVSAAVVQNASLESDTLNGQTVQRWRFRLSRELEEAYWDADFNGDGDITDVIGDGGQGAGGFVVLLYEPSGNSTGDPFSSLPSDEIVFGGSVYKTSRAAYDPIDFYDWPEPEKVALLPGGVLRQIFPNISNSIKENGLHWNASILLRNDWEGQAGLQIMRALGATMFDATPVTDPPSDRTLDADSVAFLADVVVNRPGGCWTVRFLES